MTWRGELIRELVLPAPISVNEFRGSSKGTMRKRASYSEWKDTADKTLMVQGPRKLIVGPVALDIAFPALALRDTFDTDNGAKPIIDTLVRMGLLADDHRKEVPVIGLRWWRGDMTVVRIYRYLLEVF